MRVEIQDSALIFFLNKLERLLLCYIFIVQNKIKCMNKTSYFQEAIETVENLTGEEQNQFKTNK